MKITIPTNHNFYEERPLSFESESCRSDDDYCHFYSDNGKIVETFNDKIKSLFEGQYLITKKDLEKYRDLVVSKIERKKGFDVEDRLILKLYAKTCKGGDKYYIQTGLYTGVIHLTTNKTTYTFNIIPECGNFFLNRMLNMMNHIYINNDILKSKCESSENPFIYIIYYLFVNALDKARVLGYPQQYKLKKEKNKSFHGSLDINRFINQDIPFCGKISIIFPQRETIQEIIDVLYSALKKVEKSNLLNSKVKKLLSEIKPYYSGKYCTKNKINAALKSSALNNPIFMLFKKALKYAEIILQDMDLSQTSSQTSLGISGYLIDISEVWEIYLENLLSLNLPGWTVMGQERLPFYKTNFWFRDFMPDLVLKKNEDDIYAVFDAKFKHMEGRNKDVDRNDLHQIHNYAGYYSRRGTLKACGLLYPCFLSNERESSIEHDWHSGIYNQDSQTKFIIDGVNIDPIKELSLKKQLDDSSTWDCLIKEEQNFIDRIRNALI